MKVIDLLNKIAKGEAPETIFYMGATYDYDKECMDYEDVDTGDLFFDDRYNTQILNDEVEVIEEVAFEDIEEMIKLNNVSGSSDLIALSQMQWENNCHIEKKINELIRNQKKIISKLEKEGK